MKGHFTYTQGRQGERQTPETTVHDGGVTKRSAVTSVMHNSLPTTALWCCQNGREKKNGACQKLEGSQGGSGREQKRWGENNSWSGKRQAQWTGHRGMGAQKKDFDAKKKITRHTTAKNEMWAHQPRVQGFGEQYRGNRTRDIAP